ncbi:hypothetical protein [Pseudophaeobacter flagellatus]|nr:hypothetical protein [Pseudophaeobacter flagellatus]MCD9146794.1 hypothetical protein [Pseudophaeobacter flagellatus]
MVRLIKYLVIFGVLAALALIAYAYIGPWFGADFSVPIEEVRKPVVLDAN